MGYDIVAYCSKNYADTLALVLPNWIKSDASSIHIYTDWSVKTNHPKVTYHHLFSQTTNFGKNCMRKAEAILLHMMKVGTQSQQPILALDLDCYICKDLDQIFNEFLDVAVTVNPKVSFNIQLRNVVGGVVFLQRTQQSIRFIQEWVFEQTTMNNPPPCHDQASLSTIAKKQRPGVIARLSINLFNSHPFTNSPGEIADWIYRIQKYQPSILHFASGTWKSGTLMKQALGIIHG